MSKEDEKSSGQAYLKADSQLSTSVFRDERGRVIWKLSGNTPEENEQLGIRNIQGLFLEKFPEFNKLFPRRENGQIEEPERKNAMEYIKVRAGYLDMFLQIFGSSARNTKYTPYFRGSYREVLSISFRPWGLELSFKDGRKPKGYWDNQRNIYEEALAVCKQEGRIDSKFLCSIGKSSLGRAIQTKYQGSWRQLRLDLGLVARQYWTPEAIKDKAREFVSLEGEITSTLLRKKERSDLTNSISKHYPGKFTQLRQDLGLRVIRKDNYWTGETIEKEVRRFFEEFGELRYEVFKQNDRLDLYKAICKRYPGKFPALREKLGIGAVGDTEKESISSEEANKWLRRLMQEE